jgi:hypothetical protein
MREMYHASQQRSDQRHRFDGRQICTLSVTKDLIRPGRGNPERGFERSPEGQKNPRPFVDVKQRGGKPNF